MKITRRHLLILLAILIFPVMVAAQGSGSREKDKNFAVTRSVSGVVQSKNASSFVVKSSNGKTVSLKVTSETEGEGCLTNGKEVTVIYNPKDRKAIRVRCDGE